MKQPPSRYEEPVGEILAFGLGMALLVAALSRLGLVWGAIIGFVGGVLIASALASIINKGRLTTER